MYNNFLIMVFLDIEIKYQGEIYKAYPNFSTWDELDHAKIIEIYCLDTELTSLPNLYKCIQL